MADSYGNIIYSSWRTHTAAWVVSETATQATIRVQARLQTVNNWTLSVNASALVNCDGQSTTGSGSGTTGTNGEFTVLSHDFTVNKTENSRQVDCGSNITTTYNPGTSYASVNVTIAGITYNKPNAPKNVVWKRSSDSKATGSWTTNADNANLKPWKQVIVDRIEYLNGATSGSSWKNLITANGSTTSYTDSTLKTNGKYMYAVYSRNNAGDSSHVNSAYMYTTPAAPKSVVVSAATSTSTTVTVDLSNTYSTKALIQVKDSDGEWSDVTTVTLSSGKATYTDTNPPAGTVTYRARGILSSGGNNSTTLSGSWTTSNTITNICAPNAPKITSPVTGAYVVNQPFTISWIPNHPDNSAQSNAEIEITNPDGETTLYSELMSNTSTLWTPTLVGTYTVRVHTKGVVDAWGAWSDYVTIKTGYAPTIVITSPTDSTSDIPLTVTWSVSDTTGITIQQAWLSNADNEQIENDVTASDRSTTFNGLENQSSWTIHITSTNGLGLSTTVTKEIFIEYTPPAPCTPHVSTGDDGTARISVEFNHTYPHTVEQSEWTQWLGTKNASQSALADFYTRWNGEENNSTSWLVTLDEGEWCPDTEYVKVYRENEDGSLTPIMDHLVEGQLVIDGLPPLNVPVTYQFVSVAASGAETVTEATATIECNGAMFNFVDGNISGTPLKVEYDYNQTTDSKHPTEEYHFATTDQLPYSYSLNQYDQTASVSGTFLWSSETYKKLRNIAETYSYCYWRDPFGACSYVKIDQSFKIIADGSKHISWSASLTRLTWLAETQEVAGMVA